MPRKATTGKITKKTWCRPQKSKGTYVTAGRARPGDAPYLDLSEVCPNAFTFSLRLAVGPATPPLRVPPPLDTVLRLSAARTYLYAGGAAR